MKISDEIRKVSDEYDVLPLYELADRIDREMVELPKDADGEVIHVGDTLHDRVNDLDLQVEALRFDGQWEIRTELGYIMPSWFVPKHPDSFERIADELETWCDGADVDGDTCGTPRELADRIRRLAKEGE